MDNDRGNQTVHLHPLSLEEMYLLLNDEQTIVVSSVLTEIIRNAVAGRIERMEQMPKEIHPWLTYWRIDRKQDNVRGVGLIGSKYLPDKDNYVELGYIMAKEYRRQGLMTEAMEVFLDWLYESPVCDGAYLWIRTANRPSVKLAEACGFEKEEVKNVYQKYRYSFIE